MFNSQLQTIVLPLNTAVRLAGVSDKRFAIELYGNGQVVQVLNTNAVQAQGSGTNIFGFGITRPYAMRWDVINHGNCVQQEWWVMCGASVNFTWLEVLACDCKAKLWLDKFMRGDLYEEVYRR